MTCIDTAERMIYKCLISIWKIVSVIFSHQGSKNQNQNELRPGRVSKIINTQ